MTSLPRVWNHIAHSRLLQQPGACSVGQRQQFTSLSLMASSRRQQGSSGPVPTPALSTSAALLLPFSLSSSPATLLCNKAFGSSAFDSCTCRSPRCSRRHSQHTAQRHCSSKSFYNYRPAMDVPEGLFRGSVDRFNGIIVESEVEFEENADFVQKLHKSLEYWTANKRRGIWFNVLTEHADWVPHLAKAGFEFHHAKHGYVVMYRWLPLEEYANIPDFCHTMLGVGGLVVNEKNEVLVVGDRYAYIPNSWKLPGGYVEQCEDLVDAAIREVREETGIHCKFDTVISMRHSHRGSFGCSDLYVVVALTPINQDLHPCAREIERIQWMPVDEYLQHPHVHETNRHFVRTFLDYNKRGIRFTCEKATHQVLKKEYALYYMKPMEEAEKQHDKKQELATEVGRKC